MIVFDIGLFADVIRVIVIFCGALLVGSLVGLALHHRQASSGVGSRIVDPSSVVLPWWAVISWALFALAGIWPHLANFGSTEIWAVVPIFNSAAIVLGALALWRSRVREREAEGRQ